MYKIFASSEPPKKRNKLKDTQQCVIGVVDENQLDCNQCKDGSKLSCPDKLDAITQEPLEPIHVEYIAPDHNLKCCYNASTLDKCRSPQGYLLQPPHFRIPMNDIDARKVTERFGLSLQKQSGSTFGQDRVQRSVSNNQRLISWASARMNASQLWFCPICWTHMTTQPEQRQDSQSISLHRKTTDPIQQCIDYLLSNRQGGFERLVATLSTSKTGLKHHLRNCHNIRGGPAELLDAYNLRGDDGILHRYLMHTGYRNDSAHGALLSYWRHNPVMYGRGVGFNKFIYLYIHYYASRITSAALPDITESEANTIWSALTRPFSLVETAEDREMFDERLVCENGPVKTAQEEKKQQEEADIISAKVKEYRSKDASGYLTHEELEALIQEEREQSDASYSSESEDEMDRYRRELLEKKRRQTEASDSEDPVSDSDSEDDIGNLLSRTNKRRVIIDDSDEED